MLMIFNFKNNNKIKHNRIMGLWEMTHVDLIYI